MNQEQLEETRAFFEECASVRGVPHKLKCHHQWQITTRRYTPMGPPPHRGTVDVECQACHNRMENIPATFNGDDNGISLDIARLDMKP